MVSKTACKLLTLFSFLTFFMAASLSDRAHAIGTKDLDILSFAIDKGLLVRMFAKEICSCHFVQKFPKDLCVDRAQIPRVKDMISVDSDDDAMEITVTGSWLAGILVHERGPVSRARYRKENPRLGCVLIE